MNSSCASAATCSPVTSAMRSTLSAIVRCRPWSTSERPIPDAFGYRVSYGGDTVTTDSSAMPKQLRWLVARLGGLVDRYAK